jgi:O-antigen ligase
MSLAVAATAALFSNLPLYLFQSELTVAPPLWWIGGLAAMAAPLALRYASTLVVPVTGLLAWAVAYLLLSLAWFAAFPTTETGTQELRNRVLAIGVIGLVWLIVRQPGALSAARWTVLWVTLGSIGLNAVDFVVPGTFSAVAGRAAGLYLNPNTSGGALLLGMVISAPLLTPGWRVALIGAVGVAVLATFSRAAMLAWVPIALVMIAPALRTLGSGRLLASIVAAAAAAGVAGVLLSQEDAERAALRAEVLIDRLGVFGDNRGSDVSTTERGELLDAAGLSFFQRPWTGSGLGANRFLERETGSHNLFVDHAVQHGVAGLLILPAFALALVAGSRGTARTSALLAAGFLLLWGLFSHNVLEEFHILTATVILAAVAHESYAGRDDEASP